MYGRLIDWRDATVHTLAPMPHYDVQSGMDEKYEDWLTRGSRRRRPRDDCVDPRLVAGAGRRQRKGLDYLLRRQPW